jgi:hypothetical protein
VICRTKAKRVAAGRDSAPAGSLMCPILSSVWPVTVALAKVKVKRRRDSRLATPEASQCWTVNHAAGLCCRLLRLAAAFDVGFVFFHSSIFLPFLSALFVTFSFRTSPSSNVSPLAHERESSSVGMSSEVEETRKTNFALRCDARERESEGERGRGRARERGIKSVYVQQEGRRAQHVSRREFFA